jgi:3-dehydroquinate synthase
VLVVADAGVADAARGAVAEEMGRLVDAARDRVAMHVVSPTEQGKSLETLQHVLLACARARLDRGDLVVALGGGIVGDVAGFAAATYRRGLRWVNCPTTLLSMVDASVGGKTGVNLAIGKDPRDPGSFDLLKNMVGAFHQPTLVVADCDVLASLPERVFRAGLGECVKHAMIAESVLGEGGRGERARLEARLPGVLAREAGAIADLVAWNVALKARVVEGDPFEEASDEAGGRALLNLGHTFGHAIEATVDGGLIEHGQAVALGLIAAAATSEALGLVDRGLVEETRRLVRAAGLETRAALGPISILMSAMGHDKKVIGGRRRLVLPTGREAARIVVDPREDAVAEGWRAIGASDADAGDEAALRVPARG